MNRACVIRNTLLGTAEKKVRIVGHGGKTWYVAEETFTGKIVRPLGQIAGFTHVREVEAVVGVFNLTDFIVGATVPQLEQVVRVLGSVIGDSIADIQSSQHRSTTPARGNRRRPSATQT